MVDEQFLLNDAQMQQFIADGYIRVCKEFRVNSISDPS